MLWKALWKKIYSYNISVFNQELSKTRFLWPAAATFAATPRRENSSWTSGQTWRSRLNRCPSPEATFSPAATTFTTTTWIAGTPTTSCQRTSSLMFSLYPVKRCQINIISSFNSFLKDRKSLLIDLHGRKWGTVIYISGGTCPSRQKQSIFHQGSVQSSNIALLSD